MNGEAKSKKTNGHMVADAKIEAIGRGGIVGGNEAKEKETLIHDQIEKLAEKIAYMSTHKDADEYNMNHKSRGKAIIFNNMNFRNYDKYETRYGSDKDSDLIAETLGALGYEVQTQILDPTLDVVLDILKNLSQQDHSDCDSLVIVVLSHGECGRLVDYRGSLYEIESLWEYFTADQCPSLAGKPKIILIQACSGKRHDHGTKLLSKSYEKESRIVTDSIAMSGRYRSASGSSTASTDCESTSYTIPNMADFLIVRGSFTGFYPRTRGFLIKNPESYVMRKIHSIYEYSWQKIAKTFHFTSDHVAWRDTQNGSPFIRSIQRIFKENSDKEDLLSMMTMVARDVALNFESEDLKKQVPHVMSTLTRKVHFNKLENSD